MKIVALADASHLHTQKWASYMRSRGHELEIISFEPAKLDYAQVHYIKTGVHKVNGGNWYYLLGLPLVRRHLLQAKPDLVFCHYLTSYGLIGALLKFSLPLVTRLQGTDILVTPNRSVWYRLMARYALNRCDLIMMAAAHMEPHVHRLAAGKPTLVVPLGVDLRRFNQMNSSERAEFSCICTRQLVKNSNIGLILEAVARVRQIQPAVHLTIVGDGPMKSDLQIMVNQLDLTTCVTFLGEVPNNIIPKLLSQHSLYLAATTSDGTSNSLIEAMACGTFPIVSDIPGNQPWINNGVNGFLVPLGRADLMVDCILEAFGSPKMISNAQQINLEIVRDRGDYHSNMARAEQAMEDLFQLKAYKGGQKIRPICDS
ncbi:MAG: glycosyltransferase [Anaerolineae bacterium]|nr:glycosyltransferase [Anaerolineae bacterium]